MSVEACLLVVKHGSGVVQNYNGIGINQDSINRHVHQHVLLRQDGWQTIEVSSGAVVAGKEQLLKLGKDLNEFEDEDFAQAGTEAQMRHWRMACAPYGIPVGQILATHDQIDSKSEGANIIKHIRRMTLKGMLNVINESDVAATEELEEFEAGEKAKREGKVDVGADNDWMAAHTAISVGATALLLLSDIHGFTKDDEIVPEIKIADIPEMLLYCYGPNGSGSGGMASKLMAAGRAAEKGIHVVMGNAFVDYRALLSGDLEGTRVVQ